MGCGNGRFFEILKEKNVQYFGLDNSEKLIEVAREKYPQANFSTYDGFKIPFEDNSFDQVFCIAVLHHIPSRQLRVQFLKEAQRVLKKDGLLILTTWYMWQNSKYLKKLFQNWFLKIKGQSDLDWLDAYVNWGKQGQRYIHYFTKKELGGIIKESGFSIDHLGFLNRESKQKNLFVLAKKKI